jgi:hypothetical protein
VFLVPEYMHMLGMVYRALKPEDLHVREDNDVMLVLMREDGHAMLSDCWMFHILLHKFSLWREGGWLVRG